MTEIDLHNLEIKYRKNQEILNLIESYRNLKDELKALENELT